MLIILTEGMFSRSNGKFLSGFRMHIKAYLRKSGDWDNEVNYLNNFVSKGCWKRRIDLNIGMVYTGCPRSHVQQKTTV